MAVAPTKKTMGGLGKFLEGANGNTAVAVAPTKKTMGGPGRFLESVNGNTAV